MLPPNHNEGAPGPSSAAAEGPGSGMQPRPAPGADIEPIPECRRTANKTETNHIISTIYERNSGRISAFSTETANSLQPCPSFH